jgi:hypothetical protein
MSYTYTTLEDWVFPPPPPPPPPGSFGLDIRQGDSLDCYFVAALIAFAWSTAPSLHGKPDPADTTKHKYSFRPMGNPASRSINTDRTLAVDDATSSLVFAHLALPNGNLVWPGLYEKAYGIFRGLDPVEPAIESLGTYNPGYALGEVINAATSSKNSSTYGTTAALFTELKSKAGITAAAGGKTVKPMVAWTYKDKAHTPGGAYDFTDDLIVGQHTYAVLGVTKVNNADCIVLRNPYGISTGTSIGGIDSCIPTWGPAGGFQIPDGNFAITKDVFPNYFEGYAFKI